MIICIYGASSHEIDGLYTSAAEEFGREIARRGHGIVFGGGAGGMMGAVARGVEENGGEIVGVAPSFFNVDGVLYGNCTDFIYTDTMRERKQVMEDNSDAFVMLPGGIGTFEEFFEVLTLKQLGRHKKAIAIYNINGYYDYMERCIKQAVYERFMKPENYALFSTFSESSELLNYLEGYNGETVDLRKLKGI